MTHARATPRTLGRSPDRSAGPRPLSVGFAGARYLAEGSATFALVAVGPGASMVAATTHAFGQAGIAAAFAMVVTLGIIAFGDVSGAHMNPAVTLGLWTIGRVPGRRVIPYVMAQCIGAIAASATLRWVLGPVANMGATVPQLPIAQSFAVEAGFSALLGVVVAAVVASPQARGAGPFAIGSAVGVGALVAGPLTGGSFNPARSLGPALVSGVWTAHWLYWAAPVLGVVTAMLAYEGMRRITPQSPSSTDPS